MNVHLVLGCVLACCSLGRADQKIIDGIQVDANDPDVMRAANFAVKFINENSTCQHKFKHTRSAVRQEVIGWIYRLRLQFWPAPCDPPARRNTQHRDNCLVEMFDARTGTPRYKILSLEWIYDYETS